MMRIRRKRRKICSLWGTTPILSIVTNAEAERLLGIDSETLVFSSYFITGRFTHNFGKFRKNRLIRVMARLVVFPWALLRYDIFHYFCDQGILPSRDWNGISVLELFLLKLLRKRVFIYTYGGDVRTRESTLRLGKYNCCIDCEDVGRACICSDAKQERNLKKLLKYSTQLFSMGDMSEYTPGSDNNLFFWPIDCSKVEYVGSKTRGNRAIKIVHAPNHRQFKGTKYLLAAVENLKKLGCRIELVLVERVPNERALELYKEADIVAEQFLIGWHGFLAIEAMALGKPVICYIRKKEYLLSPEECPIVIANPDNLEEAIKDLADNPGKREHLGKKGRKYIEKHYSLEAFSQRLRRVYEIHGLL